MFSHCALALLLLLDSSASLTWRDWDTQRSAHAQAFADSSIIRMVEQNYPMEVAVVQFSDTFSVSIDFVRLESRAHIRQLAERLENVQRMPAGGTNLGGAVEFAANLLLQRNCERHVMDIVTDGQADTEPTIAARNFAQQNGIMINALIVLSDGMDYSEWARENLITQDGFLFIAQDWEQVYRLLRRKLAMEIANIDTN